MSNVHDLMVNLGIKPGMAVISNAGHDVGRVYLVVSVEGSFIWVSDGKIRSISRQKQKRCKHVKKLGQAASDSEMERLLAEKTPAQQDIIIRKLISRFLEMNIKEV